MTNAWYAWQLAHVERMAFSWWLYVVLFAVGGQCAEGQQLRLPAAAKQAQQAALQMLPHVLLCQ